MKHARYCKCDKEEDISREQRPFGQTKAVIGDEMSWAGQPLTHCLLPETSAHALSANALLIASQEPDLPSTDLKEYGRLTPRIDEETCNLPNSQILVSRDSRP